VSVPRVLDFQRRVERYVLRVRGTGCGEEWTGSGFAIGPHVFVTNRHVVAGFDTLQIDTYDGHEYTVDSAFSAPEPYADLALGYVSARLPASAARTSHFAPGQRITAIGFPLGGELTFSPGRIVDIVPAPDGEYGRAIRIDSEVTHGNSGGPLINKAGRVLGVVYRLDETNPALRLALPVSELSTIRSALEPAQDLPCEG
jgi:S1-C subfamily serine protease